MNGIVYKVICQKGIVLNPSGRSLVNLKKATMYFYGLNSFSELYSQKLSE